MSTETTLPSFLTRYRPASQRVRTPGLYQIAGRLMMSAEHPMITLLAQNRGLTMLVAGQSLATALAKHIQITPEQIAVVLNGLDMSDESIDATKVTRALAPEDQQIVREVTELLVQTATDIAETLSADLPHQIHHNLRLCLSEKSYPEGSPLASLPESMVVDGETVKFDRVEPLFLPRGGVFSAVAGLVFVYATEVAEVEYVLDLLTLQDADREAAGALTRALMDFRNHITDQFTGIYVNNMLQDLLAMFDNAGLNVRRPVEAANDDNAPATPEPSPNEENKA